MSFAHKQFTDDDQDVFAQLSGDYNPIHVDAIQARRLLYGRRVVHGIHVLLWAYDLLLSAGSDRGNLRSVTVSFRNPVFPGSIAELDVDESGEQTNLRVTVGAKLAMQAKLTFAETHSCVGVALKSAPRARPDDLSVDEISSVSGHVNLSLHTGTLRRLFPSLSRKGCDWQTSALLATTRIVGMKCPGLHSLYSKLSINFDRDSSQAADTELRYKVASFKPILNLLTIELEGAGIAGAATSHYRPPPTMQKSFAEIKTMVNPRQYASQNALIVGASRGLGEVTAKLIAAGGGKACISYYSGTDEARAVAGEIVADGGLAKVMRLNVLDVAQVEDGLSSCRDISHLYYFASPKIPYNDGDFDEMAYKLMLDYYREGLLRVTNTLLNVSRSPLTVFLPSTIFIDAQEPGFCEYARAKEESEQSLMAIKEKNPDLRVLIARLPKLESDQTRGLIPEEYPDTVDVLTNAFADLAV